MYDLLEALVDTAHSLHNIPPHFIRQVVSPDGDVFYTQAGTGAKRWDRPCETRSFLPVADSTFGDVAMCRSSGRSTTNQLTSTNCTWASHTMAPGGAKMRHPVFHLND